MAKPKRLTKRAVRRLEFTIDRIQGAKALEELQRRIEELRDIFGVEHMIYHWVSMNGEQYGCGTYEDAWIKRYLERGYLNIDPVIKGSFKAFHPVDWKRLDWTSKKVKAFWDDAMSHGVGNQGLSIPIRGPAGQFAHFTINTCCDDQTWAEFTTSHQQDLMLIAHYFNRKALEFVAPASPQQSLTLSPREVEALTLMALGENRASIAVELEISENTLRTYIESARFKMGTLNTTHTVAEALRRGLIVV